MFRGKRGGIYTIVNGNKKYINRFGGGNNPPVLPQVFQQNAATVSLQIVDTDLARVNADLARLKVDRDNQINNVRQSVRLLHGLGVDYEQARVGGITIQYKAEIEKMIAETVAVEQRYRQILQEIEADIQMFELLQTELMRERRRLVDREGTELAIHRPPPPPSPPPELQRQSTQRRWQGWIATSPSH